MSLKHEAYESFKEKLQDQFIKPGQFLSLRELTEILNLSLAPVREAITKLETEGVVRILPQKGIQVVQIDGNFIRHAYQLRSIIEKEAAAYFVRHATDDEIASLKKKHRETLDKGKKQVTKDLLDFTIHQLDWHLHHWIVERMKNPFIQEVHRVNMDRIRLFRLNWELDEERFFISMEEHGKIITSLEKRDSASAVDFLERHLENSLNRSRTLW